MGRTPFIYKGKTATFDSRAKRFVNLTFHTGATIADPDGVLEGDAKAARVFGVSESGELQEKCSRVEEVVRNWIQLQNH